MGISIEVGSAAVTAVLYDNPSARDFAAMLPLDLDVENYGSNEKIAYLPRKLTNEGAGPFGHEADRRPRLLRALGQHHLPAA